MARKKDYRVTVSFPASRANEAKANRIAKRHAGVRDGSGMAIIDLFRDIDYNFPTEMRRDVVSLEFLRAGLTVSWV